MSHCIVSAHLLRFGRKWKLLLGQHFRRQICLLLDKLLCELRTFGKLVAYDFAHSNQLPLL